jgi:low temperature requirement protein LtrA
MNRDLFHELRSQLWQPPRPHGQLRLDRSVGALELFYDLVVVVLVAQAAHHLAGHITATSVGEFSVVFTIIWIAWFNGTLLHDLHGHEDARGRVNFLVQILLLVPLAAFIPDAGGADGTAFAVDAALLFAVLGLLWWLVGRADEPDARRSASRYVGITLVTTGAFVVSAWLSPDTRWVVWAVIAVGYIVAITIQFLTIPRERVMTTLRVTGSLSERFGAFVIIVLGETVTGVVTGLSAGPTNRLRLIIGLVSILVGFGSWWTYFDFAGHREPADTPWATTGWMLAHLPLTAAIAAMGAAMVRLVADSGASRTMDATGRLLCGGAFLVLLSTAGLLGTLRDWDDQPRLVRPVAATCLLGGVLALVLGAVPLPPYLLTVLLLVVFAGPWTFAVLRRASLGTGDHAAAEG